MKTFSFFRRLFLFLFPGRAAAAMLVILLVGCQTTELDWKRASQANTIRAYADFITQHRQSPHVDEAVAHIEKQIVSAAASDPSKISALLPPNKGTPDLDAATYKTLLDFAAEQYAEAPGRKAGRQLIPVITELSGHLRRIIGKPVVVTGKLEVFTIDLGRNNYTAEPKIKSSDGVAYKFAISSEETKFRNAASAQQFEHQEQFLADFDATYKIDGFIVGEYLEAEIVELVSGGGSGHGMVLPVDLYLPSTLKAQAAQFERYHARAKDIQDAAMKGDLEKVQALLNAHPNLVFSKDSNGATPLHWAGNKDVAQLLLAKGVDVNARDKLDGTPLHDAAENGHKDVAELLLANGANANARQNGRVTPLHCAAHGGYKDVAELLLASHADVNAKDDIGQTPLHYAAKHKDVAELLLANHADVNAKDKHGWTPLHVALGVEQGLKHKEVAELLRQHGGHE